MYVDIQAIIERKNRFIHEVLMHDCFQKHDKNLQILHLNL